MINAISKPTQLTKLIFVFACGNFCEEFKQLTSLIRSLYNLKSLWFTLNELQLTDDVTAPIIEAI